MAKKSPNNKTGALSVPITGMRIQGNLYRNYNNTGRDDSKLTVSVLGETPNKYIRHGTIDVFDVDITATLTPEERAAVDAVLDICQAWGEKELGLT